MGDHESTVSIDFRATNKFSQLGGFTNMELTNNKNQLYKLTREDGGEISGSRVHFPSTPVKYLADLRSRANSQQYSSIYEDQTSKIEDIERSDGKKSA